MNRIGDNLNKKYALTLCWNHLTYPGNKALIEKGAIPIDEDWDGDIRHLEIPETTDSERNDVSIDPSEKPGQMRLFDNSL